MSLKRDRPASMTWVAIFVVFCVGILVSPTFAMSSKLQFAEIDVRRLETTMPKLATEYPGARFFISSFTALSGELTFIRVEHVKACDGRFCLPAISHEKADWKALGDIIQ